MKKIIVNSKPKTYVLSKDIHIKSMDFLEKKIQKHVFSSVTNNVNTKIILFTKKNITHAKI
jgi:hypothetical protein